MTAHILKQATLTKKPVSHGHGGLSQALSSSHKRKIVLTKDQIAWFRDEAALQQALGSMSLENASVERDGSSLIIYSAGNHGGKNGLEDRLVLTDFPPGEIEAWELAIRKQTPHASDQTVKVLGAPLSSNCTGPAMLAMETGCGKMEFVDVMGGAHKEPSFTAINPFGQIPALKDGDVKLGESHAILRYLAGKYAPELYPKDDVNACAVIDMAMDAWVSYVYNAHMPVIYSAMGFAPPPADQAAANSAYAEALSRWASVFLKGKFVAGGRLSIADYKVASFCFPACEPALAELTGFEPPARIKQYVADFMAAVPTGATLLQSAGGFSFREFLQTKAAAASPKPPAPASTPTPLDGSTLTYFPLSGRAEATRLALHMAGVSFTDRRIGFQEWAAYKPKTPWGGMPTLELADGTLLGQGRAILRLAGKRAGLYPDDAVAACKVDNLLDTLDDVTGVVSKVAKEERAQSAKDGTIADIFNKLEAFVLKHGDGNFAVGAALTIADLAVFSVLGATVGTIFDNMTLSMLDPYPTLCAIRKTVATQPKVLEWYVAQESEDYWKMELMGSTVAKKYEVFLAQNLQYV